MNGTPPVYDQYLQIDETTGLVSQLKRVDRSVAKLFTLTVKAEQVDNPVRYTLAKLVVQVLAVDKSPPVIHASSTTGYIPENSPTGSLVLQELDGEKGKVPLRLTVNDPDIVSFTSSSFWKLHFFGEKISSSPTYHTITVNTFKGIRKQDLRKLERE